MCLSVSKGLLVCLQPIGCNCLNSFEKTALKFTVQVTLSHSNKGMNIRFHQVSFLISDAPDCEHMYLSVYAYEMFPVVDNIYFTIEAV